MDIVHALLAAQLHLSSGGRHLASVGSGGAGPVLLRLLAGLVIGVLLVLALTVA